MFIKRLGIFFVLVFAVVTHLYAQIADYKGNAWVTRTSRPYTPTSGLEGRHIGLWSSHGRYYESTKKNAWLWQRPFLFCTTEDMLSQSFVNPYLIPMLENAGAVVFNPKERDVQQHETIVDNDTPEQGGWYTEKGVWMNEGKGFARTYTTLNDTIRPFLLGTARSALAGSGGSITWAPLIPEAGQYAVYISYAQSKTNINDAHYTVHHAGGTTTFRVNQQMGGGTWVYLGTFYFEAGQGPRNKVVLTTESACKGEAPCGNPYTVSADAVRFGGGMAQTERSAPTVIKIPQKRFVHSEVNNQVVEQMEIDTINHYKYGKGTTSGLPRYLEAARYNTQFLGLPDSLYNRSNGFGDYNDDLRARSHMLNLLTGGSCYLPDTVGRGVPFELQFALHTDAGYRANDDIFGALTIATPYDDYKRTTYASGLDREASRLLASNMLNGVAGDLSSLYGVTWPKRELRISNYAETRSPLVPSTILELLSHQNFRDMTFAHDPNFKFQASRSIYKVLLREIYRNHDLGHPVIQPLPVTGISALFDDKQSLAFNGPHSMASVTLSWTPTIDPLESSATPTDYILYTREDGDDWDEGTLTDGKTQYAVAIKPGCHYQFRITALNAGGESFPSEVVSVFASPALAVAKPKKDRKMGPTILIVNAFDRLSGPARVNTADKAGFDLTKDVGVSYQYNASLAGCQTIFTRSDAGKEGANALGYGTAEYVGKVLAGNRRDDIILHARDILTVTTDYNIVSTSRQAFDAMSPDVLKKYAAIDFIAGLQADKSYNLVHYDLFTPASRTLLANYSKQGGRLFVSGAFVGEPAAHAVQTSKASIAESDSVFLAEVLHCIYRATINHKNRTTFSGLGIDIPVFNLPNTQHYPVQESTVLEAIDEQSFPSFAYAPNSSGEGYSAGVAWPTGVVMGFPYDCISDEGTRRIVMNAVINHLLK